MTDVLTYAFIFGFITIPAILLVLVCREMIGIVYQNQSIILAFPFP